ncbi:MAG: transport permease protein [Nitrospirales bacterium]|nr:MAG: transport permease protein [Nitrospirales bacterium]
MNEATVIKDSVDIIRPRSGWSLSDLKELFDYRDLLYFLVWRDVKVLYAQTILGFAWAILNPLIQIIIFTIIFGNIAQLSSEGIPYIVFSSIGVVPWTYLSQTMTSSSQSLVSGMGMLGKIYFPRLIFPLSSVLAKLVDFSISFIIIIGVLLYYDISPTWNVLYLPIFLIFMVMFPSAVGLWLSSLAVRFRDVRFGMQFGIGMLMYSAPIVYSASSLDATLRFFYSLNPIVGIIEGYRACLLGTPMPWIYIVPGMIVTILLFISGAWYFKRMEYMMVDVL